MKIGHLLMALALCAISPVASGQAEHNDRQIIPGKRAGLISLEEPLSQVEQALGTPRARDEKMDREWLIWPADKKGGLIAVYCKEMNDKGNCVDHIRVTSEKYFTPGGVYVGSEVSRINDIYSNATTLPAGASGHSLIDAVKDGVAFEVSSGKDGSPAHCIAIFVHKAGKPLMQEANGTW